MVVHDFDDKNGVGDDGIATLWMEEETSEVNDGGEEVDGGWIIVEFGWWGYLGCA